MRNTRHLLSKVIKFLVPAGRRVQQIPWCLHARSAEKKELIVQLSPDKTSRRRQCVLIDISKTRDSHRLRLWFPSYPALLCTLYLSAARHLLLARKMEVVWSVARSCVIG